MGSVPGLGRSLGRGNGTHLQYSCLENSMGRGAWWAIDHGVTKSWTWLSTHTILFWMKLYSHFIHIIVPEISEWFYTCYSTMLKEEGDISGFYKHKYPIAFREICLSMSIFCCQKALDEFRPGKWDLK